MNTEELEVYVTPDGLGRAAIARRTDGLFCIYVHWIWAEHARMVSNLEKGGRASWWSDTTSASILYEDASPEPGLYGALDDARRQIRSLRGFSQATLMSPH